MKSIQSEIVAGVYENRSRMSGTISDTNWVILRRDLGASRAPIVVWSISVQDRKDRGPVVVGYVRNGPGSASRVADAVLYRIHNLNGRPHISPMEMGMRELTLFAALEMALCAR